jgi:hypothetical protein
MKNKSTSHVIQPVVCSECGRKLERLEWDHIENCPVHTRASSCTQHEYAQQQLRKFSEETSKLFGMW